MGAAAVALVCVAGTGTAGAAPSAWSVTPLVSGLNNPRGIAVDAAGGVYVAEAGVAGTGDFGVTRTGAVDKYRPSAGGLTRAWSTPFTSVYMTEDPTQPPDALGPAGLSLTGAACLRQPRAVASCRVDLIVSANHDQGKALTGSDIPQVGHLYSLSARTGSARDVSDFGDQSYQWTKDHKDLWEEFPDANPYGVLATASLGHGVRTFVADAGANTISEIAPNGTAHVISYIPNEPAQPGFEQPRDATPTCIAQGPDGMLYVGTLDLVRSFTLGNGHSDVWRVDPNSTDWAHNATLWTTGLTTISACSFDRAGNFWAAELFHDNGAAPPGDLARIPFSSPTAIEHVGAGQVVLPGGVAQGPDGDVYVTTGAAAGAGAGGVVRLSRG